MLYVSRFSNPELKSGKYTAVRISLGTPTWPLGYEVAGAINDLMPYGMLNKYTHEEFVIRYKERLSKIGFDRIWMQLERFERMGKPVVLLCYEDIRVEGQTCHRTAFAEWWLEKTGEIVNELPDPTLPRSVQKARDQIQSSPKQPDKVVNEAQSAETHMETSKQISIFDM